MIHMKPSICGPDLPQVPWDVRSARRYFLELMAIANHNNSSTLPESFLSSKI
jgi:hypothetical protein